MMDMLQQYKAQTDPFWMNRLKNGLPFMNQLTDYTGGTLAKSFAPIRAGVNRNLAGFGDTLPSGFKEQTMTNLGAEEGQAFDQNQVQALMANDQAKLGAAASLNPFQPAQIANQSGGGILSAPPVQSGGFGNFLGGAVSGLINATGQAGGMAAMF